MKTSKTGIDFIKGFESLRLTAYDDGRGVTTIGYGHTATARSGMRITEAQAETLLRRDLSAKEACVARNVRVSLSQQQFDALVSLAYNIGCSAFAQSSVVRYLNNGEQEQAAKAFLMWNKVNGKVWNGLTKRREQEMAMFTNDSVPVIAGGRTLQWVLLGSVALGGVLAAAKRKGYIPKSISRYIP